MVIHPINVLSLFTGCGGLDLGLKLAIPDARIVCGVEREAYVCALLAKRMQEGCLDEFPLWSDIRTFDGKPWRGIVDCIIGGFPCQDISNAGKRAGLSGERSGLWYEMARIIGEVRPAYVFVENVNALMVRGIDEVCGSLAALGYDAVWDTFSAAQVGAPHIRKRVFILANLQGSESNEIVDHANSERSQSRLQETVSGRYAAFPPGPSDSERWKNVLAQWPELAPAIEPGICVLVDGSPVRLDEFRVAQLRASGNGVVPLQAAYAFRTLYEHLTGTR